jgi:hypothetical protein
MLMPQPVAPDGPPASEDAVDPADAPPRGGWGPAAPEEGRPPTPRAGPHDFLSANEVVHRALYLASARKEDLIDVAGPDGLAAMVALCRAGYERVECARQSTCGGADEGGDLLLIMGRMDPGALAATVRRTARLLRDDGVMVVQLGGADEAAIVRPALAAAGLAPVFTLIDRSAGRLVMHRIRRATAMRRSA